MGVLLAPPARAYSCRLGPVRRTYGRTGIGNSRVANRDRRVTWGSILWPLSKRNSLQFPAVLAATSVRRRRICRVCSSAGLYRRPGRDGSCLVVEGLSHFGVPNACRLEGPEITTDREGFIHGACFKSFDRDSLGCQRRRCGQRFAGRFPICRKSTRRRAGRQRFRADAPRAVSQDVRDTDPERRGTECQAPSGPRRKGGAACEGAVRISSKGSASSRPRKFCADAALADIALWRPPASHQWLGRMEKGCRNPFDRRGLLVQRLERKLGCPARADDSERSDHFPFSGSPGPDV